jgi:pimeloyl-ACP methyl ester carboxylesterase
MPVEKEFVNSREIGQFADVFNYVLHYYEKGEGEPLLMIHGLGQSISTFRKNIDELSRHFRVLAVDLPGHGYSDKPEINYTIEEFTEALVLFMSVMRLEKVHIFAFSTGAVIAANMAITYPEKVDRMVLISPGGITHGYPAGIRALRTPLVSDIALSLSFTKNNIHRWLQEAYFDRTRISDEDVEQVYAPLKDYEARDAVITAVNNWEDYVVYKQMGGLRMPIYVFWGECDKWHPMDMLDELADMLPYAFIATVRNAGHMIHEEKSREINRKTIECLTEPLTAPEEPIVTKEDKIEKIKKSLSNMTPESIEE